HAALARAIVAVARRFAACDDGIARVALTGGCFQNAVLAEAAAEGLEAAGIEVLLHRRVPPNDGGLALGQAAWAARLLARETT
ncbi:MAG: Kae1-like domain-containing protein, partial [Alphaproteobacteria bacterium]